MRLIKSFLEKAITASLLLVATTSLTAQNPNYLCELRNDVQVDARTYEFDVYLLRTGAIEFEFTSMQFGINVNSGMRNNGTITVSIVAGSSELNPTQIPTNARFSFDNATNCIRMTGTPPPGAGSGTIISNIGNGTRFGRIRLVNTANFGTVSPDLTWSYSLATGYITRVNAYVSGLATDITVQASQTTTNLVNPILNPPAPVQYNVTGGGSYCEGGSGIAVGLSLSESGVTYTLIRDGSDLTPTYAGTGSALSFGNQTIAGTYTVRGSNAGGSTNMNGNAIVSITPLPSAPAAQAGSAATCNQITASWSTVSGATSYQLDVSTSNTFATFVAGYQNRDVGNVISHNITGLVAGTTYYYRVRAVNSCGISANSGTISYATLSVPVQPDPISGPASPCPGTAGIVYEVPAVSGATAYTWSVPAGWSITGGQTTRTLTVTSGTAGGTISVYASNTCGDGTARTLAVTVGTISTVPTVVNITNNNTCFGTNKTLTVSGGSLGTGAVWEWFTGSCGGTSAGNGPSITVNPAAGTSTTYYVRASGACNTTACASGTVTVPANVGIPTVPVPSATTICQGTPSITVTTSASNATSYNWSVSGTDNTVTGTGATATVNFSSLFSGLATISVTANGCGGPSSSASTNVTVRPTPTASISGTTSVCHNAPSPSIIFSNPQSLPITVTYNINGGSEANINVNANSTSPLTISTSTVGAFTYNIVSVSYQTAPSCPNNAVTGSATVTVNPLPVVDAGVNQTIPFGTSTTLNATVTGTGLTYIWTPAASLVNATVVDPTTVNLNTTTIFTLTATTSAGCSASDQVTVNVSGSALGSAASATPSTVCAGTNVQLAANATGGSGSYTYSWTSSPGTFTSSSAAPSVTPTVTTVYTVVVNDGFNSTSSNVTVTVNTVPVQPVITADGPTTFCSGEDVVLTASDAASWLWSTGATTRSIIVTIAGNYTVQVTNAAGCQSVPSGTTVVTVNSLPSRPTITPAGTVNICAGSSRTLTSSIGTTYLWSNGATTQSIDAATAGSYTVQVTNPNGCLSPASLPTTIVVNPLPATPTITASGPTGICAGSNVTLTASLSTSYLWSTGATTRSITVNTAGDYSVRVTDANGCQSLPSALTTVTVNPLPSAPVVGTVTQATCSVSTGSVALSGLPAAGTWTLTRSPGGATQTGTGTTYTVTGLPAGTHTFTVTNANGCTSAASVPVVINTPPAVPTAPVMGTVTQPTCAVTTGSVGISGLPSTGTWTLTRNPGGSVSTGSGATYTATGIPAGTYTYTVTNAAGCTSPASVSITVNAPLPVPAAPVHTVNCDGGFNHAVITVTSPTGAGYEYRLNSGVWQTSNIFNDVANGNHTITVRNSSGCTTAGELFSVNCGCVNPPLLTLGSNSGSTCGITAVTVTGNTFGGSATSVTISENGGGTVTPASASASPFSFTYTPTAADAGRTVIITVTTNNPLGTPCAAASATFTLTVNALPAAPVPGTITHPTCASPAGSVVLNNLPATGDWTITRTPGGQTTNGSGTSTTITALVPGTYNFTVTNALGCTSPASANVVINAQPDTPAEPVVGVITQPTCALSTGSVALSGLPASGNWTLTRTPGNVSINGSGATRTVSAIPPGTYTFTVANAAGCVSPASAEVVVNMQPVTPMTPVIGTITHPTCELATGSIVLENMPENGDWTLIRYPGGSSSTGSGSSATVSSLPAGTYNFAVRNSDGCTSPVSANAIINAQPPTPSTPVVGTITHPTFLVATGSVVLSGLPSSGTWTLIRYPDGFTSQGTGTTRTVSGLEPGTYSFAVTNSFTCTSATTGDVVINARPGAPVVVINNPPTICENETTNLTAPAVTAGSDANLTFTYWTDAEATVEYATPSAAPAGTYYIMGTSTAGYYTIKPVVVTADQLPVANAGPDQVLDYLFGTTLNAEIPEIGSGLWSIVSGTGAIFNSGAPSTPVSGLSAGENIFSWTVTNGACDPVTDEIVVRVNNLTIPTLITPNEDGRNDWFELRGLETLGRTELTIFDRRGMKVYENSDYSNEQGNRWEGLDYNSNPLPDDTYFYVIRAANGVSISGYIVVRR